MQFTPSLQPLAQSWLRLRNLKPGKGTLAGFSFLYHVLFPPFLRDPVTSSSPRVGIRERGHAGWKRSLVAGTVVIWLWCPLCGTGAHMLIFHGTILGFTGDLHLSIADPNDTLFCWWSWLPHSDPGTLSVSPTQHLQPVFGGILFNSSSLPQGAQQVPGDTHLCPTVGVDTAAPVTASSYSATGGVFTHFPQQWLMY